MAYSLFLWNIKLSETRRNKVLTEERVEKYIHVVKNMKGRQVIIATQVDPDAISAGIGTIIRNESINPGLKSAFYYCGGIGHPQNDKIITTLKLDSKMRPISEWEVREEDNVVLVDSSSTTDSRLPEGLAIRPKIIIDHHRCEENIEEDDEFFWIEDIGAVATMVADLLRLKDLGQDIKEIDFNTEKNRQLAEMIALGIYTDTEMLMNTTQRDRSTFSFMTQFVDQQEFSYLMDFTLPKQYFNMEEYALSNRDYSGGRVAAVAGMIKESETVYLALIARHLLKEEGITLAAVWGIIDEHTAKISFRSRDFGMSLDQFLKGIFKKDAGAKVLFNNRGEGGAKLRFDMGHLDPKTPKEYALLEAYVREKVKNKLFSL